MLATQSKLHFQWAESPATLRITAFLRAMFTSPIRRALFVSLLALSSITLTARADAIGELDPADQPSSLSGSYLAGRSADMSNDMGAALAYLTYALELDRGNAVLAERVITLRLAVGDVEPAFELAEKLLLTDNRNPTARIALAAAAIKSNRFALAKRELKDTLQSPAASLTAGLLGAWADQGLGETDDAFAVVDGLTGPPFYEIFKNYHRALIADAAGREAEADAAITKTYEIDATYLRIVEAYARIKARNGDRKEALRALTEASGITAGHPIIKELLAELEAGKTPAPIAATAQAGAAELLYGVGSAIASEEGTGIAASYLQLAHYLDPANDLATVTLGDIFQRAGHCEEAIQIYQEVRQTSVLQRNAEIQSGICLDALGQTEEGAARIKRVVDASPQDIEAAIALGNLYRAHDRFAEASDAYTIGVDATTDTTQADWRIHYFRGVSYERTKRWPEAEADFKRALELNPDQPQVLNYLGYSWVDMGLNLEEALDMIRTAVDLRPNDGYIIDSLGWAYYRLGRYEDAVEQLERAVELRPDDPTINDHLGDAYWRTDRRREAIFQWKHARDMKPEETELPKILGKIKDGLTDTKSEQKSESETPPTAASSAPVTVVASADPADGIKSPPSITVEAGDSLSTIAKRAYGNSELYLRIFNANKDLIADPNVIFPGMSLTIPAPDSN